MFAGRLSREGVRYQKMSFSDLSRAEAYTPHSEISPSPPTQMHNRAFRVRFSFGLDTVVTQSSYVVRYYCGLHVAV